MNTNGSGAKRLKDAVRRFWDAKPCGVKNSALEPGSRAFYEEIEAHRYAEEFHIPGIAGFDRSSGKSVLEIGGGVGTDGRRFARTCSRYVDVDLSINSLVLARKGFEIFGLPGIFVKADAENLPFEDQSFDIVYSHGVLHHTPDTSSAVGEVHRVLRTGGEAVIMLYAHESLGFWAGQILGRLRLWTARWRMGRKAFNEFVGLPVEHRGWLPNWVVLNNITDGLGNPLSKFFTKRDLERLFSAYRRIEMQKRYLPKQKIPFVGRHLPRPVAYWLGVLFGSFWYVKAIK